MSGRVLTDAEAIAAIRSALTRYVTEADAVSATTSSEISKAVQEIDYYVEECRKRIGQLERDIEECRRVAEPDEKLIADKERQLQGWSRKLTETTALLRGVTRSQESFKAGERTFTTIVGELGERGSARMTKAREDVIRYEKQARVQARSASRSWSPMNTLSSGGGGGGLPGGAAYTTGSSSGGHDLGFDAGGTASYASGSGTGSGPDHRYESSEDELRTGRFATNGEVEFAGAPAGMVLVPLARCVDEGRVRSEADFGSKGSADELRWALTALFERVLPRMGRGGDVHRRLADADAGSGLSGTRSYVKTFEGFLGDGLEPLKVEEMADDRYEVVNGAHRIWLAQQMGITHLPARVRRMS